jgi:hypothetical protein
VASFSLTAFALVFAFLLLAAPERPATRTIVAADD